MFPRPLKIEWRANNTLIMTGPPEWEFRASATRQPAVSG